MKFRLMTNFKFFYSLVALTFLCLLFITTIIKPIVKQDSGYGNVLPELRVPLTVQESKVEESQIKNQPLIGPNAVKKRLEAMTQQSWDKVDKTKKKEFKPPPVKEDLSKPKPREAKKVQITFDDPNKYKGPIVEGWPPNSDRYMPHYIRPDENTFSIVPSKTHFKNCNLLVIVHSTIDAFNDRQGVRDTWLQYVTENRVQNVSVVFLIAKEKSGENITELIREKVKEEKAQYDDILQVDMIDHYNNLTLKSVFTIKFFLNESNFYDPPPFHLMKIDNDAYLNLPQLVKVLKDPKLKKTDMYLVGHRFELKPQRDGFLINSKFGSRKKPPTPIRVPKNKRKEKFTNKWWVPKYLYNGTKYPVILSGSGYVTTRLAATCLFNESMSLPFFHLEDVFLTGFAAENCGVARYHSDGFHPNIFNFKDVSESDILWHYLKTKSVHHMHKILMFEDLMNQYQHTKEELMKVKKINEENGL